MLGHLRQNAVAYVALFVALGGTSAYAANEWTGANIVNESLTGADVKGTYASSSAPAVNGSLTGADISGQPAYGTGQPYVNGSLTGWDIADGGLQGRDVKAGTLTGTHIADGKVTGADVEESTLAKVPSAAVADAAALRGHEIVSATNTSQTVRRVADVTVACPDGKRVVGGGGSAWGGYMYEDAIALVEDRPAGVTQWYVKGRTTVEYDEPWNSVVNVTAYAICARVEP